MKKTLVALAVTAFATSASALTIYEVDGSKVTFDGSLRMRMDMEKSRVKVNGVKTGENRAHTNLHNDGSRFGVTLNHMINDDFYGFGRVEFRFNGDTDGTDKFGDLYTEKAYVGLGSKTLGEVSFGRQATIADDVYLAGFDNAYGVFDTTMTTEGRAVVRYDYKSIEGLQIGVDYRFAEERGDDGEVLDADSANPYRLKSGYGIGGVYEFGVGDGQTLALGAGYTRDNYKVNPAHGAKRFHRDAWGASAKYTINDLEFGIDYTGQFMKDGVEKNVINGFRVGAQYNITPKVAVYGNYGFIKNSVKNAWETPDDVDAAYTKEDTKRHRFMIGTSYQVHDNVFTYLEGSIRNSKETYTNPADNSKVVKKIRETNIGAGLRVFW